jgi:hypothetical protein
MIYIDGKSRLKYNTLNERKSHNEYQWKYYYNIINNNNNNRNIDQKLLPSPELLMIQFIYTISNMNIDIIYLNEEADPILAKLCDEGNNNMIKERKQQRYYVYSKDSDFIAMKNTMYIEFGNLFYNNDNDTVYSRKVWQRYSTADYIGLTEVIIIIIIIHHHRYYHHCRYHHCRYHHHHHYRRRSSSSPSSSSLLSSSSLSSSSLLSLPLSSLSSF